MIGPTFFAHIDQAGQQQHRGNDCNVIYTIWYLVFILFSNMELKAVETAHVCIFVDDAGLNLVKQWQHHGRNSVGQKASV